MSVKETVNDFIQGVKAGKYEVVASTVDTCSGQPEFTFTVNVTKDFGMKKLDDQKYTVQVIKNVPDSFLNIGRYNSKMFFSTAAEKIGWRTHFTRAEINQLKQRDDIAIDWSKAIIEPVEDE